MKQLEVRCCCIPQKLRGWLPIRENLLRSGQLVRFALLGGGSVALEVNPFHTRGNTYLALRSEDIPIEILRQIPSFVENKESV
jgi:hypothetical protein